MDQKQKSSKQRFGTFTATSDANNDYSQSTTSKTTGSQFTNSKEQKQQSSKNQYGTLTAKMDANNDYE